VKVSIQRPSGSDEAPPEEARAEHGSALRARILEVAAPRFAAEGYGGTSMREIALAAHCTKPAVYYHFSDKRALFLTLIREEADRINDVLDVALAGPHSVRECLRIAIEAYVQHVRERRVALTLLLRAQLHAEPGQPEFDFRARRRVHIEAVADLLRKGVQAAMR